MDMIVKVKDEVVDYMHSTYCMVQDNCLVCNCQVLIGEKYTDCKEKYIDRILVGEIQAKINKI